MSMYDNLMVETDILDLPAGTYQTIDLKNFMFNYHLNAKGRLILEVGHYENNDETQKWFGSKVPMTKFVLDEMKDTAHHGWIIVYGKRPENDPWVDFHLKFVDGTLTAVKKKIWVADENGIWLAEDE